MIQSLTRKSASEVAAEALLASPAVKAIVAEEAARTDEAALQARMAAIAGLAAAEARLAVADAALPAIDAEIERLVAELAAARFRREEANNSRTSAHFARHAASRELQALGEAHVDVAERVLINHRDNLAQSIRRWESRTITRKTPMMDLVEVPSPDDLNRAEAERPRLAKFGEAVAEVVALRRAPISPAELERKCIALVEACGATWPREESLEQTMARMEAWEIANRNPPRPEPDLRPVFHPPGEQPAWWSARP